VLALTAEPGHRAQALRYGAKDFVRKPFDPEELLLRVRNLLEVRLLYKDRATAAAVAVPH
jgi:DNA-binding response OmpR family regulator